MKNWLPPELGWPVLAMARIPRPYLSSGNTSSGMGALSAVSWGQATVPFRRSFWPLPSWTLSLRTASFRTTAFPDHPVSLTLRRGEILGLSPRAGERCGRGAHWSVELPLLFLAVTETRNVSPASPLATRYEDPVALVIAAQLLVELQRCHWNE